MPGTVAAGVHQGLVTTPACSPVNCDTDRKAWPRMYGDSNPDSPVPGLRASEEETHDRGLRGGGGLTGGPAWPQEGSAGSGCRCSVDAGA